MIHFYSTQDHNLKASLEEAVMRGLAEDGGLFMPCPIPRLPENFFKHISAMSFPEIAFKVTQTLLAETIPASDLQRIVQQSMSFDAPLKTLSPGLHALELFHGPTLSFKDFGAQFMAQLMGYFVRRQDKTLHILVATSGDTGSAIAQAFLNVKGIRVWILYPQGQVSRSQEQQLTTMGKNITALEIKGTFDDCQRLVKQAFSDRLLRQKCYLTSANSINIARLLPQSFYYFYAYAQVKDKQSPIIFSVPSGNFGNLTAGLLAKKMGLPVAKFVAATNINDTVPNYLQSGLFKARSSKRTLSNAMDVGNPSNFMRMADLYKNQVDEMRADILGASFTDIQTEHAMQEVLSRYRYLMDPHGAVAYLGLQSFLKQHSGPAEGIFLETAHPAKFAEEVERITTQKVPIPRPLQETLLKKKQSIVLNANYEDFMSLLLAG